MIIMKIILTLGFYMTRSQAHIQTTLFSTTCKDAISQNAAQYLPHPVHSIDPHLRIHQKDPDFSSVYH